MEDILKRLLDVEVYAEQLVSKVAAEREQQIEKTLQQTRKTEHEFENKLVELRDNLLEKAEFRARQAIAELEKRYEEKKERLHHLADSNQEHAVEAAIQLLLQVGKS